MLWVLHVILSQALQPSTIARNWAQSLSWEIRLLRILAALGLVYVLDSGSGGNPNSCFHCLAAPLVLCWSCFLINLPCLFVDLAHLYPNLCLLVQVLSFPDLALDLPFGLG